MATKTCPACGYKVSTEASSCPQCGRQAKKGVGWATKTFGVVCGLLILVAIIPRTPDPVKQDVEVSTSPKQADVDTVPESASPPLRAFQPRKPAVTEEDRARILATATKKLKRERDKVEKTTFYSSPTDGLRTQVGAYFGLADGGSPYLRMKTVYYGDRWVFYDAVKIMADDEIVYEKAFNRRDITRDNASGSVWEVADYVATPSDLIALEKISTAKSVTIRFTGRDRTRDHNMTSSEKAGLKSVLTAYADLKQKL